MLIVDRQATTYFTQINETNVIEPCKYTPRVYFRLNTCYNKNMTLPRQDVLANNQIYHVFSRSIAKFIVFNNQNEFNRMIELIRLCRFNNFHHKYSKFLELKPENRIEIIKSLENDNDVLVEIIAYCIMPTHIHLILKQVSDQGIIKYLGRILNSYSKYFNLKHNRKGPLWTSRFKNVIVDTDEQLLHLTRYVHLNPTSTNLVENPKDWIFSSYLEYIHPDEKKSICTFRKLFDFTPKEYEEFCLNRKSYQQELSKIKSILIDNYAG